jgi:D-beta-D-heptose 7-phosphate kinase/D-beta-D-heptose 1-phosphate adenosyltransferase
MVIQQQKQLKVLVIGDSCKDIYHYGKCERISPEAPVLILKETRMETKPGMSANVVANLKAFEISVLHITNKEIIKKHRFVDEKFNQHVLRVDEGEYSDFCSIEIDKIRSINETLDAVVISDYDKGFLSYSNCDQITKYFENTPVFVDSKKNDLSCYKNSIVKINEKEYENLVYLPKNSELIITMGSKGAFCNDKLYKTEKVNVFDVCGAGDVFLSGLVYCYTLTKNLPESIYFANKCAAYSVTKFGTYSLTRKDIKKII